MTASKTPRGLGTEGRRLWRSVLDVYELEEHEKAQLVLACRVVDRLEEIAAALVGAPLTVTNSKGDRCAHPLLVEQRLQSIALTRLIASLRLPTGEDDAGNLERPQRRGAARGAYGTVLRSIGQ